MSKVINKAAYEALNIRIEELLEVVGNETDPSNTYFIELDILSDLVAEYEETYMPLAKPGLAETLQLRMYEKGLNQKKLAELLGVSTSRVSEYLNGKSEPTLKIAREMVKKLEIDPSIILGV